jgi:uncharacterized membrane protein
MDESTALVASARTHNRVAMSLAFIGAYIAGVLTAGHFMQSDLPCGSSSGCELVASDPSSFVFGVPVAVYGLVAYVVLGLIAIVRGLGRAPSWFAKLGLAMTGVGTLVSLGLTVHAVQALGTTCFWCLGSALTMILLFVTYLAMVRMGKVELPKKALDGFVGLGLACLAGGGVWITAKTTFKTEKLRMNFAAFGAMPAKELIPPGAHQYGLPSAPVTIVEFGDLACPSCKNMHLKMRAFVAAHPSVQVVFHHLPLSQIKGHELAYNAAVLAERAGDKGFWPTVDRFYGLIDELDKEGYAQVDKETTDRPVSEATAKARVEADKALAKKLGIHQTPIYLILAPNGARTTATPNDLVDKLNEPQIGPWVVQGAAK